MKRAGFTMIELIFVIVILGILAAVAIPKLSSVKADAYLATAAQSYCSDAVKSKLGVIRELKSGGISGTLLSTLLPVSDSWSGDAIDVSVNYGDTSSMTATLSDSANTAYVYYVEGNATAGQPIGCFVSNDSNMTGAEANTTLYSGSNIFYE